MQIPSKNVPKLIKILILVLTYLATLILFANNLYYLLLKYVFVPLFSNFSFKFGLGDITESYFYILIFINIFPTILIYKYLISLLSRRLNSNITN
ncbi:hypothetical protein KUM_1347 [Taylorella asinigenitalis 14/45]|uniref:Uncharacterized protein n=1 Tax=Taylorella asinigenitalis 14/45 TaxID=1091495 RepID=I7IC87_9BURK|nr:hypothetical protein KUM_1347 [Taylorella asinigenitalis 14/45]